MRYFHTIYGAPGHPFMVDRTEWSEGPLRFRDRPPSTTSSTPPSTTSSVPRGVVDGALQKLQLAQRRIEELEKELQSAESCISEARIKIQRSDEATKVERSRLQAAEAKMYQLEMRARSAEAQAAENANAVTRIEEAIRTEILAKRPPLDRRSSSA